MLEVSRRISSTHKHYRITESELISGAFVLWITLSGMASYTWKPSAHVAMLRNASSFDILIFHNEINHIVPSSVQVACC